MEGGKPGNHSGGFPQTNVSPSQEEEKPTFKIFQVWKELNNENKTKKYLEKSLVHVSMHCPCHV